VGVRHPVIGDTNLAVSKLYNVLPKEEGYSCEGRNFGKLLRVTNPIELTATHKAATPANWENGEMTKCLVTRLLPHHGPKGLRTSQHALNLHSDTN